VGGERRKYGKAKKRGDEAKEGKEEEKENMWRPLNSCVPTVELWLR